jgi:hypothetical protein
MRRHFLILAFIWLIAMSSLLGVHFLLHRKPDNYGPPSEEVRNALENLGGELKRSAEHYETGIIRLADGKLKFVGYGFEREEKKLLEEKKITRKRIDFLVEDPIRLERTIMKVEAFRVLNAAEKRCLADKHGTLLYREGSYFFIFDTDVYREYVIKYGTECKPCEEIRKRRNK